MALRRIFAVLCLILLLLTTASAYSDSEAYICEEPEWAERYDPSLDGGGFTVEANVTAYCSCYQCCGYWATVRPNGVVYTASGALAKAGETIAVDPDVIPMGAHVMIDGHEYIAEDTGSGLSDGVCIDIYCNDHHEALRIGRSTKTVTWWID